MYTGSEGSEESPGEPLLLDNAIKAYGLADIIIFTISHWCLKQKNGRFRRRVTVLVENERIYRL